MPTTISTVPGGVLRVAAEPFRYSTSYPLYPGTLTRDDGPPVEVLLKHLDRTAMLPEARAAKPHFLNDPQREIGAYRALLDPDRLGTARCLASGSGPAGPWLLVERVDAPPLVEVGALDAWRLAFQWLAGFHARTPPDDVLARVPVLHHDERFYRTWMERARRFVDDDRVTWVAHHFDAVVERLLAQPVTLIHGELYPSNVLVAAPRVCVVDWETVALGPPLVDVAALTSGGGWSEGDRAVMLRAYCDDVDEAFLVDLDACRAYLAVQWLGWSPHWSPPPELAQDWLGTAVSATRRVVSRA